MFAFFWVSNRRIHHQRYTIQPDGINHLCVFLLFVVVGLFCVFLQQKKKSLTTIPSLMVFYGKQMKQMLLNLSYAQRFVGFLGVPQEVKPWGGSLAEHEAVQRLFFRGGRA